MLRLLVCGSRDWVWEGPLWRVLDKQLASVGNPADILLINGGARGADIMARDWAMARQVDHMTFPARWNISSKAAGGIRNSRMLNMGQPTLVFAFHEQLDLGRGTADMVKKARQALGTENVKIYRPPGWKK